MRLLAAALVLSLLAATPTLATEKLRIATTGGYPPFTYVDNAGEIAGFDIDIALALCAELGAECEVVLEEWERLIPELRASSFDAIAASMSITEKRRQLVSFTDRYYSNVVRFVARKGSGFDPANPAGKTIGASRATIASDWLEANLAGTATIRLYTGQQELHRDLAAGRLMPCSATAWAHTLGFRARRAPVSSSSAWNTGWTKVSASRCATRTPPFCYA